MVEKWWETRSDQRPPPKVLQFYTSAFGMISYGTLVYFISIFSPSQQTYFLPYSIFVLRGGRFVRKLLQPLQLLPTAYQQNVVFNVLRVVR